MEVVTRYIIVTVIINHHQIQNINQNYHLVNKCTAVGSFHRIINRIQKKHKKSNRVVKKYKNQLQFLRIKITNRNAMKMSLTSVN